MVVVPSSESPGTLARLKSATRIDDDCGRPFQPAGTSNLNEAIARNAVRRAMCMDVILTAEISSYPLKRSLNGDRAIPDPPDENHPRSGVAVHRESTC